MATKEIAVTPSGQVALPQNFYEQHGFSGKTVTVTFMKVKDSEPVDIFVGCNNYQATIKRGTKVTIPVEAFDILAGAIYLDKEDDPEKPGHSIWVEKQRYPYNVHAN